MAGRVKCYGFEQNQYGDKKVIGIVKVPPFNLDSLNRGNWDSGLGCHMGVGKTKSGKWYVCHVSCWDGDESYAQLITEDEAKQLVLEHAPKDFEKIFGVPAPEL